MKKNSKPKLAIFSSASTNDLSPLLPMTEKFALSPRIKFKAFNKIDFPEPVSPVMTVNPVSNLIFAESIKAKFYS